MLLYDNKSPEARAIIFGTQKNLDVLKRFPSWYIDGTFKVSPQLFYQLITVHGEIPDFSNGNPWTFPLVYILLTHKDADNLHGGLLTPGHTPRLQPWHCHGGLWTSATEVYLKLPSLLLQLMGVFSTLPGYFAVAVQQRTETLIRESVNNPTTGKLEHSEIRVWVRRIQMLAFVPVDEVVSTFMFLQDHIPANLGLDDFLEYFESTWIQGASTSVELLLLASLLLPGTAWRKLFAHKPD